MFGEHRVADHRGAAAFPAHCARVSSAIPFLHAYTQPVHVARMLAFEVSATSEAATARIPSTAARWL